MKTILLMRHAKAQPGESGQRDFDRPLASRGTEDAARMGQALKRLSSVPEAIVASPAARAKETAEAAAKAMGFSGSIRWERALYNAAGDAWIDALRDVPASAESVLVVAHSPGIAEAAGLLCGALPVAFDIPTGGLIALVDDVPKWRDLAYGAAAVRWFLRPKLIERL